MVPVDDGAREAILGRRLLDVHRNQDHPHRFEGVLRVEWPESGLHDDVTIAIDFPEDRRAEPTTSVLKGAHAEADSHASSGKLCLWLPPESRWRKDDPNALEAYLDEVEVHVRRMLIREADPKKEWPGGSRGHGVRGWIDYLLEQGATEKLAVFATLAALDSSEIGRHGRRRACPCGSRRRLGHCHIDEVRRYMSMIEEINEQTAYRDTWVRELRARH